MSSSIFDVQGNIFITDAVNRRGERVLRAGFGENWVS